jgi:hypothetical protein
VQVISRFLPSTDCKVELTACSTSRDNSSASLTFQAACGSELSGTMTLSISLSHVAPSCLSGTIAFENGGSFRVDVSFSYSGDINALTAVTTGLTNPIGTSSSIFGGV